MSLCRHPSPPPPAQAPSQPSHASKGVRSRRHRRPSTFASPATAHPLEDEDLLEEILLRLPPQPSSLLRASLVCTGWRRLVSDPVFARRFCAHHGTPPLLGFFHQYGICNVSFTPILDPPDRIRGAIFALPQSCEEHEYSFPDCRHGLALHFNWKKREAIVWDPMTGHHHCVAYPPGFSAAGDQVVRNGAVMCAARDDGAHVHGDWHFKLVLLSEPANGDPTCAACLYDSETGVWGDIVSTSTMDEVSESCSCVMVGNAVYWFLHDDAIIGFDVEMQSLVVIDKPAATHTPDLFDDWPYCQLFRAEDGGLGLAILAGVSMEMWEMKPNADGAVTWMLQKTVQLDTLLPVGSLMGRPHVYIQGYVEDSNAIILWTNNCVFMMQLGSRQIKKLFEDKLVFHYHPYTSFYASENSRIGYVASGGFVDG